jgi:colicin import membrane protein
MKDKLKRIANLLLTVVFTASLSGCASIVEYWAFNEESGAAVPAANGSVSGGVSAAAQESPEQRNWAIYYYDEKSKAEAALRKTEADLTAANERIRELEGQTGPAANQAADAARGKAEADAADQPVSVEAALRKAEADLAAANQRIRELEAAVQTGPAVNQAVQNQTADAGLEKAEADAADARKKAADAEAARKKVETDLAASRKQAADAEAARKKAADEAAAQKKAAETAEAARKKAADEAAVQKKAAEAAEAARKKAADEAAEAKKRAEELNAQLLSRMAEQQVDLGPTPAGSAVPQSAVQLASFTQASPVSAVASPPPAAAPVPPAEPALPPQEAVLPKYYTVGAWPPDCFWKIAELVYGDPFRWPILYEANRDKLEDPDNPDLLERGVVLEIPTINGELREGNYTP